MAVYTWPDALIPQRCVIGSQGAGEQFKSPYNGTLQAVDFVAERWVLSVTLPQRRRASAGAVEAFFMRLRGGVHRVRAWHFARPQPAGTMRGAPLLQGAVARGANSVTLYNAPANSTLLAGDMLGLGGQLLMVADSMQFSGAGAGTVSLVHRMRGSVSSGAAVTWDRPTADFVMPAWLATVAHFPGGIEGAAFDLEEAW